MDISSMRGKGAKIFAKLQQRMENYVITDENRRQGPQPNQSKDEIAPKETTDGRGPYVRPGSSIAITPKAQYKKQGSPRKLSSGYCTDMEDDYRSPYKPQLNYFSDCEYSVPDLRGRSRKTRRSNRSSWESEKLQKDAAPQKVPEYIQKHYEAPEQEESRPPIAPFRRVIPPGKSPYHSSAGHRIRDSSLSRTSISPARNSRSGFDDASAPKHVWSRVAFTVTKPVPQQKPSQPVISYPCARKYDSPSRSRFSASITSQDPPQSHRAGNTALAAKSLMPSFYQRKPQQKPMYRSHAIPTPTSRPTNQRSVQNVPLKNGNATDKAAGKSNYPTAVCLLEKPMERKVREDKNTETHTPSTDNSNFVGEGKFIKQLSVGADDYLAEDSENLQDKQDKSDQRPCSNSSTFTSTLPSRCLTLSSRSYAPTGNHRVIKIASNGLSKPSSSLGAARTSSLAHQPSVISAKAPGTNGLEDSNVIAKSLSKPLVPTSIPIYPLANQSNNADNFKARASPPNSKEANVTACIKVLDPAKVLLPLKKPTQFKPSPTLNALLQSEKERSNDATKTLPVPYEYPCQKVSNSTSRPSVVMKSPSKQPVMQFSQTLPTRSRSRAAARAPQPLGIIAEGMKGKGAKMFEKQQKRMERYTKETSQDDFPELQSPKGCSALDSPVCGGRFFYTPPSMAGFPSAGEKLEPGNEVRNGMRHVVGEFQNNSKPGRAKRPSETKKKGRDPLYYQQQLFYRAPSAADFVESPLEAYEAQSDTSSAPSSKLSSLSSFNAESKGDYLTNQGQENNYATPLVAPGASLGLNNRASMSLSSISSQKSAGPRIAPKPSRELIQRQLSKPTSPVSTSPTPEMQQEEISFSDVVKENSSKCIEELIERIPDDRRTDGNSIKDFDNQ